MKITRERFTYTHEMNETSFKGNNGSIFRGMRTVEKLKTKCRKNILKLMGTNYPKSNRRYDDHIYEYCSFFKNAIK